MNEITKDGIWPAIGKEPLEKTKRFARALFEAELTDKITWFDKRDGTSNARKDDPEMDLDTFLEGITESTQVRYIIGREEYINGKRIPAIALFLRCHFKDEPHIDRFAWLHCPFIENYQKIGEIFEEVYGIPMFSYERLP